jgi:hypothetical protein
LLVRRFLSHELLTKGDQTDETLSLLLQKLSCLLQRRQLREVDDFSKIAPELWRDIAELEEGTAEIEEGT